MQARDYEEGDQHCPVIQQAPQQLIHCHGELTLAFSFL